MSIFDSDDAVLEVHHHVGGAVNLEQAADADDVGMPGRGRQVPQKLGFLDELLEAERVDFLGVRTDRDDRASASRSLIELGKYSLIATSSPK